MIDNKSNLKEKLKDELKEIFQFESKDLDFGIYRIMNYKRKEIENFIEKELIEEINNQLESVSSEEKKNIEEQFKEIKQKIKDSFGTEALENGDIKNMFKNTPLYEEYYKTKKQLEEVKISEDLEKEIYNHLINFFSRYYDNGDFISKQRYSKNEKYVIPYNGEEVALYWANKDQYYIKTTEYFRKYTFIIKELIVNFRLVEAEEDNGNIKSFEKKFFVLNKEIFNFNEVAQELNIYFEYRGLVVEEVEKFKQGKTVSQDKINEEIIHILQEKIPQNIVKSIFEKEGDKTIIEKNLYTYTKRNTKNYFIHKDLKVFLERELDFYIKNEFLDLNDLQVLDDSQYFGKLRSYMNGIKAFRNIALNIIKLLAQIEDFQKKIWEKKKFVIDTHYVITLDKIKKYIGDEFLEKILEEILVNEKQLEEWNKLFGVKVEDKNDLILHSTPHDKEWKKLPIDTNYFNNEFKWKLLVALSEKNDLDEILDGILIKSENFQALNLLLNKYDEKIQTVYIDPPYNTGNDGFLYKDKFHHASWITMIENRLFLAYKELSKRGIIFTSIDDNEQAKLKILMDKMFGGQNFEPFIWKKKGGASNTEKTVGKLTEYVLSYLRDRELGEFNFRKLVRIYKYNDEQGPYNLEPIEKTNSGTYERKTMVFPIIDPKTQKKFYPREDKRWTIGEKHIRELIEKGSLKFDYEQNRVLLIKRPKDYEDTENLYYNLFEGLGSLSIAKDEIKNMGFNREQFSTPKPVKLIKHILEISSKNDSIILDFFAGSGTTAHAVMELNKEDSINRKFILVEMDDFFYDIIIPRIKKIAYSSNWQNGKPKDMEGIGVLFKYHTLEQYEDALENINLVEPQKTLHDLPDYFINYMLDWETKSSNTFLNLKKLKDPFNYELKMIENYRPKDVKVDLVETFSYLLGLNINRYKVLEDDSRRYIFVFGERKDKRLAIVWRSVQGIDFIRDEEVINNQLKDCNPDEIYINGDALVKGFKAIEPVFKTLMFEKVE